MIGPVCDADDATLLAVFVGGESVEIRDQAFAELVHRHGPMVAATCRRWLRGPDLDDAVQTVFVILARRAAEIRVGAALPGWLHQVAWNVARHGAASAKSRHIHEQQAAKEAATMPRHSGRNTQEVDLDAALVGLPETYRTPLILHYLEGLPQAEVARRMGIKENTIAMRISRGRGMLREQLERLGAPAAALGLLLAVSQPLPAHAYDELCRLPDRLREGTIPLETQKLAETLAAHGAVQSSRAVMGPILLATAGLSCGLLCFASFQVASALITPAASSSSQVQVLPAATGWRVDLAKGGVDPVAAEDGSVIAMDGERVRSFSSAGVALWSQTLDSDNGRLLLGGGGQVFARTSADGKNVILGLEIASGTLRWSRSWPMGPRGLGLSMPEAVAIPGSNDIAVLAPGDSELSVCVTRLDRDGTEVWRREWPVDPSQGRLWSLEADRTGRVYAGSSDGQITRFAPQGAEAWSLSVGLPVRSLQARNEGGVFAACDDALFGGLSASGPPIGASTRPSRTTRNPPNRIVAFAADGTRLWSTPTANPSTGIRQTPSGDIVCTSVAMDVPSSAWQTRRRPSDDVVGGHVELLSPDGAIRWSRPLRAPILPGPRIDRAGGIVLAGADGWLIRMSAAGSVTAERDLGGSVWGITEMRDGRLMVACGQNGPPWGEAVPPRLVVLPADWYLGDSTPPHQPGEIRTGLPSGADGF